VQRYSLEFKLKAVNSVSWSHHQRLHSSLDYQSPVDYERAAA